MLIYIEKKLDKLLTELSPDIIIDCRLLSHKQILLALAEHLKLAVDASLTIREIVEQVSHHPPPYRRILIAYANYAPARLALSLHLLSTPGKDLIFVQSSNNSAPIIQTLRDLGWIIKRRRFDAAAVKSGLVYLALLIGIALTVVLPYKLRQAGIEGGIAVLVAGYFVRRLLWREVWRSRF